MLQKSCSRPYWKALRECRLNAPSLRKVILWASLWERRKQKSLFFLLAVIGCFFFQKLFLGVHRRLIRLLGAGAAGDTETLQKKLKQDEFLEAEAGWHHGILAAGRVLGRGARLGRVLAASWPRLGRVLAASWPRLGRVLVASWSLLGRVLVASWSLISNPFKKKEEKFLEDPAHRRFFLTFLHE